MRLFLFLALPVLSGIACAQTLSAQVSDTAQTSAKKSKHAKGQHGAGHDVGSGAGDIGKGAAKGVGSAAKGTGKAAADLATLHPIDSATDLSKGAVGAGKNVGVGAVKGTGKMLKGTGKAIKHIF